MKIHICTAAGLLLIGTVAMAQDQAGEQQAVPAATSAPASQAPIAQAEQEPDPGEEVVCRTERITGSLTRRRRTCLTRNEWDAIESRTRDELNRQGRQASGGVQCRQDQNGGC